MMSPDQPSLPVVVLSGHAGAGRAARPAGRGRGLDGRAGRQPLRRRPAGLGYTLNPGGQRRGRRRRRQPRHRAAARSRCASTGSLVGAPATQDDVTVPPGESVEVPFALTLPDDAAPGDHVGGIVAERAGAAGSDSPARRRTAQAEPVGRAVADRLRGHAEPVRKGDATVTYTIHNTGNAILTARQAVSVSGPFGRWAVKAGRIADSPALLPGDTEGVRAAARCDSRAAADGDRHARPAAHRRGGLDRAARRRSRPPAHAWTVPWSLLLLVVVVLCGLVAAVGRSGPAGSDGLPSGELYPQGGTGRGVLSRNESSGHARWSSAST